MVKLEWGTKRTCQECASHFYDLRRSPIACPKCGSIFEIQTTTRGRRGRAAVEGLKDGGLSLDEVALVDDIDLADELEAGIEDDSDIIEDTSELGEDLDDIPDVLDHDSEPEEG